MKKIAMKRTGRTAAGQAAIAAAILICAASAGWSRQAAPGDMPTAAERFANMRHEREISVSWPPLPPPASACGEEPGYARCAAKRIMWRSHWRRRQVERLRDAIRASQEGARAGECTTGSELMPGAIVLQCVVWGGPSGWILRPIEISSADLEAQGFLIYGDERGPLVLLDGWLYFAFKEGGELSAPEGSEVFAQLALDDIIIDKAAAEAFKENTRRNRERRAISSFREIEKRLGGQSGLSRRLPDGSFRFWE